MHIILVEPFAHRVGHYGDLSCRLACGLSKNSVPVTVVTFRGFLVGCVSELDKTKFKHMDFISNSPSILVLTVKAIMSFLQFFSNTVQLISNTQIIVRIIHFLETFLTLKFAERLNKDENSTLMFCYDGELIGFLTYALYCNHKKLVYKIMDYSRTLPEKRLKRKIKRYIENQLCRKALERNKLVFICNTLQLLQGYMKTGFPGECVYTTPLGIVERREKLEKSKARSFLKLPTDDVLLLVFGVGHGGKNFDTILKANQGGNSGCRIIFAGKILPSCTNHPRQLAKKYNCEKNVIVLDEFIPSHKVPYYFSAADGLLLSYKKDFVVDSGVLLQGVGFDLPVIASNSGWIGQIVRENELGITFTPENSSSLRSAMTEFIDLGESSRYRMVKNVTKCAESLSRSNVVEEYIELFKKTIGVSTL